MKLSPYSPNSFELDSWATRIGATLKLEYKWQGSIALPAPHMNCGERAHDLWKETCFEFFFEVLGTDRPRYYEINLSPSGKWNGYVFTSYRSSPLTEAEELKLTHFELRENSLTTEFKLGGDLQSLNLKCNATAIINDFEGREKFWALSHSQSGKPDFHDAKSFIYYLAP